MKGSVLSFGQDAPARRRHLLCTLYSALKNCTTKGHGLGELSAPAPPNGLSTFYPGHPWGRNLCFYRSRPSMGNVQYLGGFCAAPPVQPSSGAVGSLPSCPAPLHDISLAELSNTWLVLMVLLSLFGLIAVDKKKAVFSSHPNSSRCLISKKWTPSCCFCFLHENCCIHIYCAD